MSIQEIERAVSRLSAEELSSFSEWFEDFVSDQWDRQIQADASSGKLQAVLDKAENHLKEGRCTPL